MKMYLVVFSNYGEFEIKGIYTNFEVAQTRMVQVQTQNTSGGHVTVYEKDVRELLDIAIKETMSHIGLP